MVFEKLLVKKKEIVVSNMVRLGNPVTRSMVEIEINDYFLILRLYGTKQNK